jgi:D-arabinose 1-dehydrogenase-like Zn-dependent alcohol dehydrogenase
LIGVGSVSRSQLEDAARLAARGIVTPQVDRLLPLEEVARAHEIVEGGAASGRVVLKP